MQTITVSLNDEQFDEMFEDHIVVKKFSKSARKRLFKEISKAQDAGDNRGWIHWFIRSKELTSAEVYVKYSRAVDSIGGPLLDLLIEKHSALFEKTGINFDKYDGETVTDIVLLEGCHDILIQDEGFMADAVDYINNLLDRPCIRLANKKWLSILADEETYTKHW